MVTDCETHGSNTRPANNTRSVGSEPQTHTTKKASQTFRPRRDWPVSCRMFASKLRKGSELTCGHFGAFSSNCTKLRRGNLKQFSKGGFAQFVLVYFVQSGYLSSVSHFPMALFNLARACISKEQFLSSCLPRASPQPVILLEKPQETFFPSVTHVFQR